MLDDDESALMNEELGVSWRKILLDDRSASGRVPYKRGGKVSSSGCERERGLSSKLEAT